MIYIALARVRQRKTGGPGMDAGSIRGAYQNDFNQSDFRLSPRPALYVYMKLIPSRSQRKQQ